LTHGEDGLGGSHAVVGDEDLADDAVASSGFDVVFDEGGGGVGTAGEGGFVEGGGAEGRVGVGGGDIFVEEGALELAKDVLFGRRER
jgi:hypothetical protein